MLAKKICYLWLSCFGSLFAQQQVFTVVSYENKQPLANVSVYKENQLIATTTNDGSFSLDSTNLEGLYVFNAFGFETLEVTLPLSDGRNIIYLVENFETLSEVIIQSTIIPQSIQKIPASINVISAADFNRTDATNILESFTNVPGIYVNQGALNTNKINIRGIGGRSQYSTNRLQAFFDGIPLTTAEGELTLDDFDQETLDRIEIIKGPTSSIYGAGLGGAVHLFSKSSEIKKSEVKANTQFGSFNTQKQVFQANSISEQSSVSATFTQLTSDGYRENGSYDRKSGMINGNVKSGENGKFSYLANFTKLKAFIPSSINLENFLNNPQTADINWAASEGFESYDRGMIGASYTNKISPNLVNTTSVFLSFRNGFEPRPFDILKEERISSGIRTQFNWKTKLFSLPSELSFGAAYYHEWYETGTFENLYNDFPNQGSVLGNRLSSNEQTRNFTNYFSQINLDLTEKWNLEAGFNLNTTKYSLLDLFTDDNLNQTGSYRFETIFSPRIGTSYQIGVGKNVFAAVSQGFSTPTVAETLQPDGAINTNLRPELGTNYEIGFKGNWLKNKIYTEISLYSIQVSDLLVANRIAEDQYVGLNAGKTNHNGIEFLAHYRMIFKNGIVLKPYLNAAFNFFEFDKFTNDGNNFSGNKLPGIPKHTTNFGADFQLKQSFTFSVNWRSVGEIPLDDGNSGFADAYNLVNLKAGYTFMIAKHINLNLYGGVNNVFDEKYASSILTNAVGFGGRPPRYYYPGNPVNYYGGFGMNYIF